MNSGRWIVVAAGLMLCLGLAGTAGASPLIDLGVSGWNAQATGEGTSTQGSGNSTVNLQSDLGMQRQWTGNAHFILSHGLPILPDLMLETAHIFNDGSATIDRDITWQGKTFQANGLVQSQLNLKMQRVVAFWNPLDNPVVNLRLGLEARHLSIDIPLTGTVMQPGGGTQRESASAGGSGWLPLGYAGLTLHLPAGIDLGGGWSYVSYSSSYLSDYRVQASYHFDSGLYIAAGWRRFRLHLDTDRFSVKTDVSFKGFYTGIGFAF